MLKMATKRIRVIMATILVFNFFTACSMSETSSEEGLPMEPHGTIDRSVLEEANRIYKLKGTDKVVYQVGGVHVYTC